MLSTGGSSNREWAHILAGDEAHSSPAIKLSAKPQPLLESNTNGATAERQHSLGNAATNDAIEGKLSFCSSADSDSTSVPK